MRHVLTTSEALQVCVCVYACVCVGQRALVCVLRACQSSGTPTLCLRAASMRESRPCVHAHTHGGGQGKRTEHTGHVMCVGVCTGYWAVDAEAETAMGGAWKKGPGVELFQAMKAKLGRVPILAEDLGVITSDVVQLR